MQYLVVSTILIKSAIYIGLKFGCFNNINYIWCKEQPILFY